MEETIPDLGSDKPAAQSSGTNPSLPQAPAQTQQQNTPKVISNPVVDPIAAPTSVPTSDGNTSGQGSGAAVPEGVKGWGWGPFLLSWIWAIGNNVWIGLLALIPYLGFIMTIILGIKGREWAWQAKHWDSVEQFNDSQKKWVKAWLIWMGVILILSVLLLIIIVAINPAANFEQT